MNHIGEHQSLHDKFRNFIAIWMNRLELFNEKAPKIWE